MIDPISWEFAWPYLLAALAGGYFLGAIPFGLILTRLAGLGDVRNIGSGNIGATNVLRTGRKGLAAFTLALDTGKGAAAVLIGAYYGPDMMIVAALGALIGHLFPVWLKFRGGKGVATAAGLMLALALAGGLDKHRHMAFCRYGLPLFIARRPHRHLMYPAIVVLAFHPANRRIQRPDNDTDLVPAYSQYPPPPQWNRIAHRRLVDRI